MIKLLAWIPNRVAAAILVLIIVVPLATRMRGVKEADRYAESVRPRLQADPRFARVQCGGGGTINEGCLWVIGTVASEQDFAALQALVASTHPPVPPLYQVRVEAPASVRHP